MHIFIPKETASGEVRAAATPEAVARLVKLGAGISVETGLGAASGFPDHLYAQAGASVIADRGGLLAVADMVIRVRKPSLDEIGAMKAGALHIGHLEPFTAHDVLEALMARGVDAIAMEMIPRTIACPEDGCAQFPG